MKVGHEQRVFEIHTELLCGVSSYFTAALKGEFKEAQTQTIGLREESNTLFERFLFWIYSGSLFSNEETDKDIEWDNLLAWYAFGEARNILHLKNSTINALINKKHGVTYIPARRSNTSIRTLRLARNCANCSSTGVSISELYPVEVGSKKRTVETTQGLPHRCSHRTACSSPQR